ncbi:general transcription factor 3C polypeptide 2 isoform X5 [Pipra filicauda]|uniref:General transcription factor 3C polypeptide 2 isoform X5 n=1 Tax=Pipra filicauda TaxID=649802 RepID=A0A7R5KS80_9PASS|nr:general transcription factor 3C polypeptide 2 isoform X5 [Pipra filicauda]
MASSAARGPRCRERSRRGRLRRASGSAGRSRSRSGDREGEQRALRQESPSGDPDCDGGEAAKSPKKNVRPRINRDGAAEGHGESSANGSVPPPGTPGKPGGKGKAEVLLLELSPPREPIRVQKMLGSSEEGAGLDTPRGGRPKRRAAKVALLYLQELAEELMSVCQPPAPTEEAPEPEPECVQGKHRSRRRKEEDTGSDDPARDADFVPSQEVLQAEEEEEEGSDVMLSEASEPELEAPRGHGGRTAATGRSKPPCRGLAPNGFPKSIMAPVEKSSSLTCSLREQKHSQWEFPDWIPMAHRWTCLSDSEAAPYLPAEEKSPLFSIQREGIEDDGALYRVNRFSSLQPHPERLDISFFVGGPVWAMEWCPTPEGSAAPQYVAVSCHRSMEETHSVAGLHTGPALLQLWGLGALQLEQGSPDKARLAYAIAADHGCVWDMKFCPSGAWEPPATARTHPQMSRLGLLAAAFSDGRVVVYALPHPGALRCAKTTQMGPSTSTLSARCSALPHSRWAPSRQGTHPSAGSASASPGCPPSPTIIWQQGFTTVLLPSCPALSPGPSSHLAAVFHSSHSPAHAAARSCCHPVLLGALAPAWLPYSTVLPVPLPVPHCSTCAISSTSGKWVSPQAPWPSGTCSPSPCCNVCTSPMPPSSSTLSSASRPTTMQSGASSGARPTTTSWSRQAVTARSSSGTCGDSTSPSTASSGS